MKNIFPEENQPKTTISDTREKGASRRYWCLLSAIITAAFIMRVVGCFWGLPLLLHPDEPATVDYAIDMLSRHSWMAQSFDRPDHFEIKCDAILFAIFSRLYYHQPAYAAFQNHAHVFYLIARLFTAIFGTAIIPVIAMFTEEVLEKQSLLYRRTAALVASCGVAFLPVFVRYSTLANPDVVLCFFVILFAWMLRRYLVLKKDRYVFFAALLIAVCVTIKYNGAILCLPLALAIIYRSLRDKMPSEILRLGIISVLLVIAGIFVIAPNLFLDYQTVIASVIREARPNHLGADGLSFLGNLRFYLLDFADSFGIVTIGLMLWGLICLLRERDEGSLCLLVGFLYWICMSILKLHWSRWGIPIYPFYLILTGIALADISQRAREPLNKSSAAEERIFFARSSASKAGNTSSIPLLLMLRPVKKSLALTSCRFNQRFPRSLHKGAKWLSAAVSLFTVALLTNVFLLGLSDTKALTVPDSRNLALRDFRQMGITAENSLYEGYTPFDPAGYLDKTDAFSLTAGKIKVAAEYAKKEYFIMSDSFSGRYAAEPERYAEENGIYAAIAEQYPVVYRLEPDGNRRTSKWIVRNIADCLDYLCRAVTCGGSPITVYRLRNL